MYYSYYDILCSGQTNGKSLNPKKQTGTEDISLYTKDVPCKRNTTHIVKTTILLLKYLMININHYHVLK